MTELRKRHRKKLNAAAQAGESGDHAGAEKLWREYLKVSPDDPDVLFNVGVCIMRRSDSPADRLEAAEYFERVVANPASIMERKADAMNNLGHMAERVGHTDKAAIAYGFALKMCPGHGAARVNLGDCKRFFGDYAGAQAEYNAVLDQDPESPEAHFCAGMIALLLGDYERGWSEYRWRFQAPSFKGKAPFVTDKPEWQGESLAGKTLLLRHEQGFGDAIQFIRYAAEIKKRWPSARVLFHCEPAMERLLGGALGLDGATPYTQEPPPFDCYLPIMDCPWALGTKSEADIPPARCIRAMPDWPVWRLNVGNMLRQRVALVWAGSPTHGKDRARSIPAKMFQPMIDAHPEIDFFSLQCGPKQPEVADLARVTDLAPQVHDWTDTAQMLMCMDLLISVDTACVHLAGAVGVPCWVLCPHSPDWRWQLGRTDSPWYGKMQLFRQPSADDWTTPIQQITEALK